MKTIMTNKTTKFTYGKKKTELIKILTEQYGKEFDLFHATRKKVHARNAQTALGGLSDLISQEELNIIRIKKVADLYSTPHGN